MAKKRKPDERNCISTQKQAISYGNVKRDNTQQNSKSKLYGERDKQ